MKDSFYFPHDYNAANDQKVLKLRAKFNNAEGYGIYFMILEAMAQEEDGILDNDCIAQLSLSYSLAIEQLKKVINYCLEVGLFQKDRRGIYSKRLIVHKEFRKERKSSGLKGAKSRWGYTSANTSANTSAIGSANAKERKGKERKYNTDSSKKKYNWNTLGTEADPDSQDFKDWVEGKGYEKGVADGKTS